MQRAAAVDAQLQPIEIMDVEPIEDAAWSKPIEIERAGRRPNGAEMEPIPIDTTAELLGRAKPRTPRARAPRRPRRRRRPGRGAGRAGRVARQAKPAKKAAAPRRSTRSKKAPPAQADDEQGSSAGRW